MFAVKYIVPSRLCTIQQTVSHMGNCRCELCKKLVGLKRNQNAESENLYTCIFYPLFYAEEVSHLYILKK